MTRSLTAPGSAAPVEVATIDRRLERLRRVAWVLDSSLRVPGTGIRFGVDSLIGLVPGLGDLVAGAMSLYIIAQGARLGLPRSLLARMGWNVAVDTLVGEVPVLGDLFDVAWKANMRNLGLLEEHLQRPTESVRASRGFVAILVLGLVLLTAGAIALAVVLFQFLNGLLKGGILG